MSTDQHPSNGATPSWWPPPDAPDPAEGVVVSMPPRTAGIGPAAVVPPPPPPPPPRVPTPAQDANGDGWPDRPATAPIVADAPVPEPAKPRSDRLRNVRTTAHRNRRWIAVGGAVILAMVGLNWWANDLTQSVGHGVAAPLDEHNQELTNMVAQIAASKSAPSQVSVTQPLAWLKCPINPDAKAMIGLDPNTQYSTLDPERAAAVDTQAAALVTQNPAESLRITAANDKNQTLTVLVGGSKGQLLIDCSGANAQPPRQDGDRATTPTTAKQG